jgi:hypothetical protein
MFCRADMRGLVLIALVCLCSCSTAAHWVNQDELLRASSTQIDAVDLLTGEHIEFDEMLGWYDQKRQVVEGRTLRKYGADTIQVNEIQSARIHAKNDPLATTLLVAAIVSPFILIAYLLHHYFGGAGA